MGYLWGFRHVLHYFGCLLNEPYPLKKLRVARLKMEILVKIIPQGIMTTTLKN